MQLKLSSKVETLKHLSSVLQTAEILPLVRFYAVEYINNKTEILNEIQTKFTKQIIVRSSSVNEDNQYTSNAGRFDSVMDIDAKNSIELSQAIEKVIKSYGTSLNSQDEVFIQPMIENVIMSGVILSADLDTLSPYYIINYDESGKTDSVTSGNTNELKIFISLKNNMDIPNEKLNKLITATKECEYIFNNQFLDIEFAFTNEYLYILQVRAIVMKSKENLSQIDLFTSLNKLSNKIKKLNSSHPNLLGDKTIFGVMPDWNPAEIIGVKPKMLALSLYKELITDETWAYQRDNYGYRNLRSHPLLVSFLGVPFIDVRISFNSFIPKKLDDEIAKKLVNYYLNELSRNKNYHDKVEFEIIYSCYYFGLNNKLLELEKEGFTKNELNEIKESLLNLTNNIIDINTGLYKKDLNKVDLLRNKFNDIVESDLSLIDKIYWLIKDVKRYGTLPFAGVARAAFIAVQFLNSFVKEDILSKDECELFLNSLNTISKQLSSDIKKLDKERFLEIYGHLRPGTYDISSMRYDESYEFYFDNSNNNIGEESFNFTFSKAQQNKIEKLLIENKLETTFEKLIIFIKEAIEGREYTKFVFTKHLSQILKYIEKFGNRFEISRDDLAYLDIQQILNLYSTLDYRDVSDILKDDIKKNKEFYQYTKAVKLPSLIVESNDIFSFHLEYAHANFVTLQFIQAEVADENDIFDNKLENKIICIKSADPGYDYLFSKNIGGLITCYGGANSHMAIRCAELGIPAAIGCGEMMFNEYKKANLITIDAANKQVKIIS